MFKKKLRKVVDIDQMQMGFMLWKSTVVVKKLFMLFADLEKAYDQITQKVTWWELWKHEIIRREI